MDRLAGVKNADSLRGSRATLLTLSLCFGYNFLFDRSRLYGTYGAAVKRVLFVSCFSDKLFISDIEASDTRETQEIILIPLSRIWVPTKRMFCFF
jgi:hypothetical protein